MRRRPQNSDLREMQTDHTSAMFSQIVAMQRHGGLSRAPRNFASLSWAVSSIIRLPIAAKGWPNYRS